MPSSYNRFAGHSIERLAALSDGIFAVAMTLLVLDLRLPAAAAIHREGDLLAALAALAPRLLVYLMSFLTLGIFWIGQQTQLNHLTRADRDIAWIHLAFLFLVTLMPFSTGLMAAFIAWRVALAVYWANILLLGAALFAAWRCAAHSGLVAEDAPEGLGRAVERRILIAQALYAFGFALCAIGTYWSLGFIVLVQLNYAFAPRLGRRRAG
ncbi:MAG: DUF1211 domain-containing protein [Rhodospirillales bacterium]|nr:DUF1211 domain-containing protein [Rhodospirillales bacterium]